MAICTIPEFKAKPIGIVEEGIPQEKRQWRPKSRYQVVSRIRIFDEYADGLAGLGEYSHLIVVWWMRQVRGARLRIRPYGRAELPEVGIFSTRFPPRPNPIGLSVVELVEISGSRLGVKALDAWTGSFILDLKPYNYYDIVKAPRVPKWFSRYWRGRNAEKRYAEIVPWLGP